MKINKYLYYSMTKLTLPVFMISFGPFKPLLSSTFNYVSAVNNLFDKRIMAIYLIISTRFQYIKVEKERDDMKFLHVYYNNFYMKLLKDLSEHNLNYKEKSGKLKRFIKHGKIFTISLPCRFLQIHFIEQNKREHLGKYRYLNQPRSGRKQLKLILSKFFNGFSVESLYNFMSIVHLSNRGGF